MYPEERQQAIASLVARQDIAASPINAALAAVSVGVVDGELLLDLCYEEDSRADVDLNLVMTGSGNFIEIQGAAEGAPFIARHIIETTDVEFDDFAAGSDPKMNRQILGL